MNKGAKPLVKGLLIVLKGCSQGFGCRLVGLERQAGPRALSSLWAK